MLVSMKKAVLNTEDVMCHNGLVAVFWDEDGLSKVSEWVFTDTLCVGLKPAETFTSPLLDNSCEGL